MKKTDEYFYECLTLLADKKILPTAAAYWNERELREKAGFEDRHIEGWYSVFRQSAKANRGVLAGHIENKPPQDQ